MLACKKRPVTFLFEKSNSTEQGKGRKKFSTAERGNGEGIDEETFLENSFSSLNDLKDLLSSSQLAGTAGPDHLRGASSEKAGAPGPTRGMSGADLTSQVQRPCVSPGEKGHG